MSDLGDLIEARGVTLDLQPDDLVSDIVIIAEVLTDHGPTIAIANSDNMSWIKQAGMVHIADTICQRVGEDDDQ